ncbi:MAG: siderophore-interacting protein [Acidimicrobiales bacterium]
MTYTPGPTTAELAQRLGASAGSCEVVTSVALSPSVREVVLRGQAEVLGGRPGNDVMVRVEAPGETFLRRRFSVRALDAGADTFTLWVTTDHEGPASAWAASAIPGDHVDVVGPRGKVVLDPTADWHLFVGDLTGLAAFYRLAESIPAPGRAAFVVEIDHLDDALTTAFAEGVEVTAVFVKRRGRSPSDPAGLLNGLATFAMPPGVGHAYVAGEFHAVRAVTTALRDRGLDDTAISHKPYWRVGRRNAEHGEPDKSED